MRKAKKVLLMLSAISLITSNALAYTVTKTSKKTTYETVRDTDFLLRSPVVTTTKVTNDTYNEDNQVPSKVFAVGPKIALFGLGVEGKARITDNYYGRLGFFKLNTKKIPVSSQLHFKTKVNLSNIPLMLDYHPMSNSPFKVSLGVTYRENIAKITCTPEKNIIINGHTYTPAEVGTIRGKIKSRTNIAPILSIGYDSSLLTNNLISFDAEVGVMYINKPKISLVTNGTKQKDNQLLHDLNKSVVVKKVRFSPVLGVGMKINL